MSRDEKVYSDEFIDYMDFIVNHENYADLPIVKKQDGTYSWFATAKTKIGKGRKAWAESKARQLGYEIKPGVYSKVMRELHPTKQKPCQICGQVMSIYYHYPSANLLKAIKARFGIDYTLDMHISDIWDDLLVNGEVNECTLKTFLALLFKDPSIASQTNKEQVIAGCELLCRKGGKKYLSPGAMSNFPDRFDGFHTYNRCCRSVEDKGRHTDNMRSYTKDRRAYEYWSDGNIHAANLYMGSAYFKDISADHIGPISLGFIHDPAFLQPMGKGDNSTKRDRLTISDVDKLIAIEAKSGKNAMSWYSKMIWDYIKATYKSQTKLVSSVFRDALKQNMVDFMYILGEICSSCGEKGISVLVSSFITPKSEMFEHSYGFSETGMITKTSPRHFTERSRYEMERFARIAIESVFDFNSKDNRHLTHSLDNHDSKLLMEICTNIHNDTAVDEVKVQIDNLLQQIQVKKIKKLEKLMG